MYRPITKLFAGLNLLMLVVAGVLVWQDSNNFSESALIRGDFPAFYAAGKLIRESPERLYVYQAQQLTQRSYWPSESEKFLYYTYPPQIALVFAVFSDLSPRTAHNVWIVSQLAFLAFALSLINRACAFNDRKWIWDSLLSLAFLPLTVAIISGQNTAFSLILLAATIVLSSKKEDQCHFMSGAILGLLAYKPHFMLLAAGVLVLAKKKFFSLGLFVSLLTQFTIVTMILGSEWISNWIDAVQFFNTHENNVNADGLVSLGHLFDSAFKYIASPDFAGVFWMSGAAYLLSALLLVVLLGKHLSKIKSEQYLLSTLFFLPPLIVFYSPHTMYYDSGLILLSAVALPQFHLGKAQNLILIACFVSVNLLVAFKPILFGSCIAILCILTQSCALGALRAKTVKVEI